MWTLKSEFYINPIALRKAKIVCNFGLSECNRVNIEFKDLRAKNVDPYELLYLHQYRL